MLSIKCYLILYVCQLTTSLTSPNRFSCLSQRLFGHFFTFYDSRYLIVAWKWLKSKHSFKRVFDRMLLPPCEQSWSAIDLRTRYCLVDDHRSVQHPAPVYEIWCFIMCSEERDQNVCADVMSLHYLVKLELRTRYQWVFTKKETPEFIPP